MILMSQIERSVMFFESPIKSKPTKPIEEHFIKRTVYIKDGGSIDIKKNDLPYNATHDEIAEYISNLSEPNA